jgi:ATP-dependent protease HslVU (ClpYQ) peptidase subunit
MQRTSVSTSETCYVNSSVYIMGLLACAHAAGHAAASWQLAALDVAALAAHALDHTARVCVQTNGSTSIENASMQARRTQQALSGPAAAFH